MSGRWPPLVRPMLATAGDLPTGDRARDHAFEMKWDGLRAVVYVVDGQVRLLSRSDRDVTATYPELASIGEDLAGTTGPLVLDGEVVAVDARGRPDFGLLQRRMNVADPRAVSRLRGEVPVTFLAFDLLRADGRDLTAQEYRSRRAALERLPGGRRWAVPPAFDGDGDAAMAASLAQGLEGVVAKRLASPYRPGRRSSDWLKVKHIRTQEVLVGGWRPGQGARDGEIGALLVGVPGPEGLVYAGRVGTGFTQAVLTDLKARLAARDRATSPFASAVPGVDARGAHWVTPTLVGEVAFSEWTADRRLRHPRWRGLRPDTSPRDVRPE